MKKIKLILIIIFSVLTINFCIGQSQELIVNAASLPQVNENVNRVNSNVDDTRNELINKLNTIINNLINGGEAGGDGVWKRTPINDVIIGKLEEIENKVNNIQSSGGGETAQEVKDIKKKVDSIDVKKEATDAINEVAKYENPKDTKDDIFNSTNKVLEKMNELYRIPLTILKLEALDDDYTPKPGGIDWMFWDINHQYFSSKNPITMPFYAFAYSIVLLFFAINLTESTLKYEIMTPRGALSILGRIAISKLWVDLSGKICFQILGIISYLIKAIYDASFTNLSDNDINSFSLFDVTKITISLKESNVKFVGSLIDTFLAIILWVGFILMFLVITILSGIILIKLAIRSIEIAVMLIISPVFFACYATETTKQYFRNFIITFIQIAAQLLYMTILVFVAFSWSTTAKGNITDLSSAFELMYSITPTILIFVMLAIMIVKPPKFLSNLIH